MKELNIFIANIRFLTFSQIEFNYKSKLAGKGGLIKIYYKNLIFDAKISTIFINKIFH